MVVSSFSGGLFFFFFLIELFCFAEKHHDGHAFNYRERTAGYLMTKFEHSLHVGGLSLSH